MTTSNEIICPHCGATELHPNNTNMLLIRAYKVEAGGVWHSQCLVCSGAYDAALNYNKENHVADRGWFSELEEV